MNSQGNTVSKPLPISSQKQAETGVVLVEKTGYEIARDFSAPVLSALTIIATVCFGLWQLSRQNKNNLETQRKDAERNIKIELFKELNALINEEEPKIREIYLYALRTRL